MKVIFSWVAAIFLAAGAVFFISPEVSTAFASDTQIIQPDVPRVDSEDYPDLGDWGNFVSIFGASGPLGVLVYGTSHIIKQVKESKLVQVEHYKTQVIEAEQRYNKEHDRADALELELEKARARVREAQDRAEHDKEVYHLRDMSIRKDHRTSYDALHTLLTLEIKKTDMLEGILSRNGIPFPDAPPPMTKGMINNISDEDRAKTDQVIEESLTDSIPKIEN